MKAYGGEVESLTQASSAGVGVRVIVDHREGFAYAGTLDEGAVLEALAEARDNAQFGEPDEYNALAEPDGVAVAELDLWPAGLEHVPTADKVAMALELEKATTGRDPRVLWAGVEPSEPLSALYRANERAARAAGLAPDPRDFKPHVTLARMRGAKHRAVARFLQENGALDTQPFLVTRFVLLSARPGTGGGPYGIEADYPFDANRDVADDDEDWADEAAEEQRKDGTEAR